MKSMLTQLCALSVFCGIALSLTPEGGVKKATGLCCMLLLTITMISAFRSFDYGAFALETARYREMGSELSEKAEERSKQLSRLVIEREYEDHVRRQAAVLGMEKLQVELRVRWDTAGVWVPESVRITGSYSDDQRVRLTEILRAELGIDTDRQEWILDEA